MKVVFCIHYHCFNGQKMFVSGSSTELGQWNLAEVREMEHVGDGKWILSIDFLDSVKEISYRYILIEANRNAIFEPWNRIHQTKMDLSMGSVYLYDYWRAEPSSVVFYTSAFTNNIFAHKLKKLSGKEKKKQSLHLKILCPYVKKNQKLLVSGNQESLGNWNAEQAIELYPIDRAEWEVVISVEQITFPFEYKFIIREENESINHWESGENRTLSNFPNETNASIFVSEYPFRFNHFHWKGAGTAIPVFSLRSKRSFGIGDLGDLKLMIDWAKQTNQSLVQILPINDTTHTHTWADSYPYSAISIYAIHPVYVSLNRMNPLKDKKKTAYFEKNREILNAKDAIDYDGVESMKLQYFRLLFDQEGKEVLASKSFGEFWKSNQFWLIPYAAFCYLRDRYHTADFSKWEGYEQYDVTEVDKLLKTDTEAHVKASFVYYMQFVLHEQLKDASEYARKKGVVLKGDLPIGIHRNSVEVWVEPAYFNQLQQAGAPPDFFSNTGQNWSFPTYNWDTMKKDGYQWWKNRFNKISEYFDCFRIDHILGFFRIWEIPVDYVQGLCGHFRPALPLTKQEIEVFGIEFSPLFLKPVIQVGHLNEWFGSQTAEVKDRFFTYIDENYLTLQEYCNTQKKIQKLFEASNDADFASLQSALFAITSEVLFLEDPYEKDTYHPRILASQTRRYKELNSNEQVAFDKLAYHFFYERHNDFWKNNALKRLTSLINSSGILICGEDLGMIPKPVEEVMQQLHILSLELERTPKKYGISFTDLQSVPYLSVCTTSTHDMNPMRNWWDEDRVKTQEYYQSVLHKSGLASQDCTPAIAIEILKNHLNATSMLTVIPWQDWLAIDEQLRRGAMAQERINIPENPNHYWCYRMHISLEELLKADQLNQKIRDLIFYSDRS